MDKRELRYCFGRFATGVTVVTYAAEGERYGITVNSFTSVSLDPPLLLVSIDRQAKACNKLEGKPFVVNILSVGQEDLAMHFAGRPKEGVDIKWQDGEDSPRLDNILAWFECKPWQTYDGGDHVLYLGEIQNFHYRDGQPLVFYTGKFTSLPLAKEGLA
ncbi:flavin reductase family protein [Effusibacillus lacus]|uniref:Oxidoreductase n=1 Tax=Effusibacillus lacus TaxID=1348429 RepID=A0A292YMW1_9BACL|nr:flavin reductase family protein [Effusibacillus lacus]TCS76939.1 flavin reductase (DIM6/NTAB) family NADH-FMN oxidoreductase RutF [Effusibacillus lacus]GAX91268.1 oxidoreductase [Effusibacillus lacus]